MKTPLIFLILSFFTFGLLLPDAVAQSDEKTVFSLAEDLYKQQKYAEALRLFEAVAKSNPRNPYARNYIAKCRTAIASNQGPTNDIEGQLAKIIIPEINFAEAPIGDVLDYFTARAEELTGGKVRPNFIYKGSSEQRNDTLITLSLRNVPMTDAIRYVGQLSKTHIKYEQHAIVADPNYRAAPVPALDNATKTDPVFGQPATSNLFD